MNLSILYPYDLRVATGVAIGALVVVYGSWSSTTKKWVDAIRLKGKARPRLVRFQIYEYDAEICDPRRALTFDPRRDVAVVECRIARSGNIRSDVLRLIHLSDVAVHVFEKGDYHVRKNRWPSGLIAPTEMED